MLVVEIDFIAVYGLELTWLFVAGKNNVLGLDRIKLGDVYGDRNPLDVGVGIAIALIPVMGSK